MTKTKLYVIAGATATGKTETAITLAKRIDGEIISADSMQVYKHMNIGTAKPTMEERKNIPHHLIDVLEPDEAFSVALFQTMAKNAIKDIVSRNKTPIVCGGTGFYLNALLYDNCFEETKKDETFRQQCENMAQTHGNLFLHQELQKVDEASAKAIHPNNVKRVIRALEYLNLTGQTISSHNGQERQRELHYDATMVVLAMERGLLYERIEKRVDHMLQNGLVEEVSYLLSMGYDKTLVSMQGLGYKEIISYLQNEMPLHDAIVLLKKGTRHFAKRQETWFRHQSIENCCFMDIDEKTNKHQLVETILNKTKQE